MPAIDITATTTVQASADHVWTILADEFLDADRWVTSIHEVAANPAATTILPGAPAGGRACTIKGFGVTDERILQFDPDRRTLTYTVASAKVPGFVRDMRNQWDIQPSGAAGCQVTSRITANAAGLRGAMIAPMLRRKLRTTAGDVLADLSSYAQTGQPRKAKPVLR